MERPHPQPLALKVNLMKGFALGFIDGSAGVELWMVRRIEVEASGKAMRRVTTPAGAPPACTAMSSSPLASPRKIAATVWLVGWAWMRWSGSTSKGTHGEAAGRSRRKAEPRTWTQAVVPT
ncbi:hypothetical protein PVAP13_5NG509300 [Panicum virgatum]|uniref:Uncharacterized protein n=1 Tax=Panicum virgatum TaxID=38727 RepID=A0A8T0RTI6_PANVG|nr:hypothetical protein PVAP13_5NG509300 [Panicum virgatum]